jgi:hypothetical protein
MAGLKITKKRGGHPMTKQAKILKRFKWTNMSTFRADIQEYLKSISYLKRPLWPIRNGQAKNLSLSENSGYRYIPVH